MIPIKEAISTGAWLHCEFNYNYELIQFRIKVLSYRKLNLSEVDEPEKINFRDEGTFVWIMDLEVVNLTKERISSHEQALSQLILVDQDGFKFYTFQDFHLCCGSKFAVKSKTKRFDGEYLFPKIKAVGAMPFLLPDDDDAIYSISMRRGSIKEV